VNDAALRALAAIGLLGNLVISLITRRRVRAGK
jgi:hypothetical protein